MSRDVKHDVKHIIKPMSGIVVSFIPMPSAVSSCNGIVSFPLTSSSHLSYNSIPYFGEQEGKSVFIKQRYVPPDMTWSELVDDMARVSARPGFLKAHKFICDNVDRNMFTNSSLVKNERLKDTLLGIYLTQNIPKRTVHTLTVAVVPTASFVMPLLPFVTPVLSPSLQQDFRWHPLHK